MQTGMKPGFRRLRTGMVGKEKVQPLSLFFMVKFTMMDYNQIQVQRNLRLDYYVLRSV